MTFSDWVTRMSSEREAALRRIAIVMSSLPVPIASRLLGSLDAETTRTVRRSMTALSDVDPLERKRALQAFSGSLRQQQSNPKPTSEDEILLTAVRRSETTPDSLQAKANAPDSPGISKDALSSLAFLGDVEDDNLVRMVAGEHPQTVALVLAAIAPAQAARVLPRLEPNLRIDAISRIGRLGDIPTEMVDELADHLRVRMASAIRPSRTPSGQHRIDAIFAAMPQDPRYKANSESVDDQHQQPLAEQASETAAVSEAVAPPLRIAPETKFENNWSTDDVHQHLLRLPAVELRDALANVETRDALLTLCGLPSHITDAVITTLPKAAGKQIRMQLLQIGAMELREIDSAKERVALASMPKRSAPAIRDTLSTNSIPVAA